MYARADADAAAERGASELLERADEADRQRDRGRAAAMLARADEADRERRRGRASVASDSWSAARETVSVAPSVATTVARGVDDAFPGAHDAGGADAVETTALVEPDPASAGAAAEPVATPPPAPPPPAFPPPRCFGAFVGPALLVSVGYVDPGNWATCIGGGSQFGYSHLSVVAAASLAAMLLQVLAARVGVVSGRDLARASRERFPRPVSLLLWVAAEIAIAATDIAEVIGAAVALKLLFNLPVAAGVWVTAADVLILLALAGRRSALVEAAVGVLVVVILVCFIAELAIVRAPAEDVLAGFVPQSVLVTDADATLLAVGIIGATVMPHNLFLGTALAVGGAGLRAEADREDDRAKAAVAGGGADAAGGGGADAFGRAPSVVRAQLRSAAAETVGCLAVALFVNVAILVTSAAAFHSRGLTDVATLEDAHALLGTVLKDGRAASVLFALALLASGQSSTITGTLAGQVVMEGFVDVRVRPALRRVVTRVVTIAPAAIAASLAGDAGLNQLLILSQVVLSFCLPFALVPLMVVVADAKVMGAHAARGVARAAGWVITAVIVALNVRSLWAQLA